MASGIQMGLIREAVEFPATADLVIKTDCHRGDKSGADSFCVSGRLKLPDGSFRSAETEFSIRHGESISMVNALLNAARREIRQCLIGTL